MRSHTGLWHTQQSEHMFRINCVSKLSLRNDPNTLRHVFREGCIGDFRPMVLRVHGQNAVTRNGQANMRLQEHMWGAIKHIGAVSKHATMRGPPNAKRELKATVRVLCTRGNHPRTRPGSVREPTSKLAETFSDSFSKINEATRDEVRDRPPE